MRKALELARFLALASLVTLAACHSDPPDGTHDEALALVNQWYADRASGWTLTVDDTDPTHGFGLSQGACPDTPPFLRYMASGYEVYIRFNCPGPATFELEALSLAFSGAEVPKVPHGLALPGWLFQAGGGQPITVDFLARDAGRLAVRLNVVPVVLGAHRTRESCQPTHPDTFNDSDCYVPALVSVPLTLSMIAPVGATIMDAGR